MKPLRWRTELEFEIDGVNFQCAVGDYTGKTNRDRFILLKDRAVLEQYAMVFAQAAPKTILEFGIFQGGSPVLFSLCFDVDKFVGVDIAEPVPAFDEFCRTHPIGSRIRTFYGVSQTDERRIREIAQAEFGSRPLDVIIDDASHRYEYSRRTFEIAFPLLRPGGTYVIEDWGWAHWGGYEPDRWYGGQSPLSMLIMQLLMLCASRSDLISEIRVFPAFAFVRKSPEATPFEKLSLDGLYTQGNIELVAPQHWNLKGVVRVIATRLEHRARHRLERTRMKLRKALRGDRQR